MSDEKQKFEAWLRNTSLSLSASALAWEAWQAATEDIKRERDELVEALEWMVKYAECNDPGAFPLAPARALLARIKEKEDGRD